MVVFLVVRVYFIVDSECWLLIGATIEIVIIAHTDRYIHRAQYTAHSISDVPTRAQMLQIQANVYMLSIFCPAVLVLNFFSNPFEFLFSYSVFYTCSVFSLYLVQNSIVFMMLCAAGRQTHSNMFNSVLWTSSTSNGLSHSSSRTHIYFGTAFLLSSFTLFL